VPAASAMSCGQDAKVGGGGQTRRRGYAGVKLKEIHCKNSGKF